MTDNHIINIETTEEYELLADFFIENGLEVSEEEPVKTDTIKCWKITIDGDLAGAAALAKREGKFILDGIAVDQKYRKMDIGKQLLELVIAETKAREGKEIFLVARAPGFFRRFGFEEIEAASAPLFFECLTCPQFRKSCHPEIMKLSLT